MTEQSQQIALYQGVNVEKAAYMAAFSQAGGLQSIIEQITQQAHEQAKGLDASTAANRKKLASIAYSVAQAKTGIDGEGKDLVSEAKAKIKVVDDNRKAVRDKLDTLRDTIRQPVTDYEQAEQARLAAIQAVLDQLDTLASANDSDGRRIEAESAQAEKAAAERAANVENQRKVNRTVMAAMLECGFEEEAAKAFLIKVVQGKVPHLKVIY